MTNSDPGSEPYSTAIDMRVLLFTLGVSLVASLLFSIAPAIHFLRPNLAQALRQNAGTATKGSQRFRKLCGGRADCAQRVCCSAARGCSCARSTISVISQSDSRPPTSSTFSLDPTTSGYGEDRTAQIITGALDAVQQHSRRDLQPQLPRIPNSPETPTRMASRCRDTKRPKTKTWTLKSPGSRPGYFATLHQPLLAGREFTPADAKGQPKVAVVNLAFAKRFLWLSAKCARPRAVWKRGGHQRALRH